MCVCVLCSFCSLSELGLTRIPSKLLQQLPNLEDLDLSLNKLTAVENEGVLPQVKKLSFAGNQLSSTDGLTAFPNLENVNVTNNPTLEVKVFIFIFHFSFSHSFVVACTLYMYSQTEFYRHLLSTDTSFLWTFCFASADRKPFHFSEFNLLRCYT